MTGLPHVLVCGAGVVGAAVAQRLTRRGARVTIVDRAGVAPAASGKAGGFLALDWNDATPLGPLARRSFALHRELAEDLDADYGYRPVETLAAASGADPAAHNPAWLDGQIVVRGRIGSRETTAQVHPGRFTHALVADALARGARMVEGRVERVLAGGEGGPAAVVADGRLPADAIVVALGPWTGRVGLALPPVGAIKGASITLAARVPAQAVFSEYVAEDGSLVHPEIYPRTEDEVYVCGAPSAAALPPAPEDVTVEEDDCRRLRSIAAAHSSALARAPVTAQQACFRPVTTDGVPLIGSVAGDPGVIVATGHGPWGILNAPATGEMVAEMILDGGARTLDQRPFEPSRAPAS